MRRAQGVHYESEPLGGAWCFAPHPNPNYQKGSRKTSSAVRNGAGMLILLRLEVQDKIALGDDAHQAALHYHPHVVDTEHHEHLLDLR